MKIRNKNDLKPGKKKTKTIENIIEESIYSIYKFLSCSIFFAYLENKF